MPDTWLASLQIIAERQFDNEYYSGSLTSDILLGSGYNSMALVGNQI